MRPRFGGAFAFSLPLGLPNFISSCGFGGMRTSASMMRLVSPIGSVRRTMFPTPKLNALRLERSRAIESYASVEQSLNDLFADLIGTTQKLAGVVFFRISNANSAHKIIETLLKKKFGNKFDLYWNGDAKGNKGVFGHLRSLSQERNEIVHWNVVNFLDGESRTMPGPEAGEWVLEPPNFWDMDYEKPQKTTEDLQEFTARADFIQHSIFIFLNLHGDRRLSAFRGEIATSWRRIFEQPCFYPPPEDHPSHTRWIARENPPQPSGA